MPSHPQGRPNKNDNPIDFRILLLLLVTPLTLAANDSFPGRKEFPQVPIYAKAQLKNNLDQVLIIDARSNYEYETIHINNSVNDPVASRDFVDNIRQVRKHSDKPIVFYCNGRTCFKSYKAAKAAMDHNIKNVFAYDAGMFEWAKTCPELTTLPGNTPLNPSNLLSKQKLKSHML